jgi:hypothetical protein
VVGSLQWTDRRREFWIRAMVRSADERPRHKRA